MGLLFMCGEDGCDAVTVDDHIVGRINTSESLDYFQAWPIKKSISWRNISD